MGAEELCGRAGATVAAQHVGAGTFTVVDLQEVEGAARAILQVEMREGDADDLGRKTRHHDGPPPYLRPLEFLRMCSRVLVFLLSHLYAAQCLEIRLIFSFKSTRAGPFSCILDFVCRSRNQVEFTSLHECTQLSIFQLPCWPYSKHIGLRKLSMLKVSGGLGAEEHWPTEGLLQFFGASEELKFQLSW